MEKTETKKLGYDIRIGFKYNYFEAEKSEPILVKVIDIIHDGNDVVYSFKRENSVGCGATIYPKKLKPKK